MKNFGVLLFFSCCYHVAISQAFYIELPKRTDIFTENFIAILNDAPYNFIHLKGKAITKTDTLHPGSRIFLLKQPLIGATASRFVTDSSYYAEFFYGDFNTMEDAFDSYENLYSKINKALGKRSIRYNYPLDTNGTVVKLEKVGFCANRGFYHYNIALQVIRLLNQGKFRLMMQVYSGKPQFYYRIMPNEPISSFNMVNTVRNNLGALQNEYANGCPTDLTPFVCKGKKFEHDTIFITYQKTGFDDYPNARTEFDVYMANLRVSLGSKYVFYMLPVSGKGLLFKRMAFIKMDDIEKSKRSTVLLSLIQLPELIPTSTGLKKQYALELSFAY